MNTRSIARYAIGFVSSIVLTLIAYVLVTESSLRGSPLIGLIVGLAIVQLFVQLVCFLHLGEERRPRWRLKAFIGMALVLTIVVLGSIWIMGHLDYHMMSPRDTDAQLLHERDKGF